MRQGPGPQPRTDGSVDLVGGLLALLARAGAGYLLGAGHVAGARRLTLWGLRHAPDDPELCALRGQVCLRAAAMYGSRRLDDAIACLEEADAAYGKAIVRRARAWELHRERGLALLRLAWALGASEPETRHPEILRRAVAEMTTVIEAQPRRAEVLHERGMAHATLRMGAPDAEAERWLLLAVADLEASLRLRPHAHETLFHRGELHLELARLHRRQGKRGPEAAAARAALEDAQRLLRAKPGLEPALLLRSMAAAVLARLGQDPAGHADLAISSAATVLEQNPRHTRALLVRAEARVIAACNLALQADARASLVWRQALADLDSASDAVGLRGREDVGALRAGARGEWAMAQRRAGALDAAREAWLRSLEDFERAVDDDPADADRLIGRARAQAGLAELATRPDERAARRARAAEDLAQATAIRPDDLNLLVLRADLAAAPEGTDPGDARSMLEEVDRALGSAPDHEGLRAARRRLLLRVAALRPPGEDRAACVAAAMAECERAVRDAPADALAHYDHARALFLGGRPAEAYAALEQAVRKAPGLRHTARHDPIWAPVAHADGFRQLVEG